MDALISAFVDEIKQVSFYVWGQTSYLNSIAIWMESTVGLSFRGRPCTPRTGTGTFTTTILPPRQMVRQKYQKHQNISLITRLPGAPDNSIEKGDSRELLEQ